eukprot:6782020-Alexandrium_andersonii.AAC.1
MPSSSPGSTGAPRSARSPSSPRSVCGGGGGRRGVRPRRVGRCAWAPRVLRVAARRRFVRVQGWLAKLLPTAVGLPLRWPPPPWPPRSLVPRLLLPLALASQSRWSTM